MRKYTVLFLLMGAAVVGGACKKLDSSVFDAQKQAQIDDQKIQAYLAANSIVAVKDPSGLYYKIIQNGTGTLAPGSSSQITVKYTGKLLNGSLFDQANTPVSFYLGQVIPGWQIGLPHIKAGGKILLLIPSALGYGNQSAGSIPPNSVLVFEIELLDVK